ncbi:MAG: ATP-binding protein [Desulfobulbaceae bacterium]|nr:ATP-binding protein [Desulfobulbaceae bacterium]
MTALDILQKQIASGQDSSRQFKADVCHAESLASEMAAFANSEGGTQFTFVADDGSVPGLGSKRQIEAFL